MTHHTSRITDVVPANFLPGIQTMETIAEALLLDEMALSSSKEKFSVLHSRRRCLKDELASVERLISDVVEEPSRLSSSIAIINPFLPTPRPRKDMFTVKSLPLINSYPVLLVCRRWRTTTLADPRLWTTIPLIGSERVAYWKALESRIEWTSALPLHLLSHFTDESGLSDPIARCRHFSLVAQGEHHFLRMFSPFEGLLEFLSVMDTDIPHADGIHTARVDVMDEAAKVVSLDIKQWFVDAPGAGHRLRSLHGL
ncbi:hypothetical protein CPB85DRAFT_1436640 [Mucidula mucida]|nr:hypothetical protein CPB85DRAFT_1436640 [Mucidula mucida]